LPIIVGDYGVKPDHKDISVAESIGGVAGQAAGGSLRRNLLADGFEEVSQSGLPPRNIRLSRGGDIVVPGNEKVRHPTLPGQSVNEGNEADIPLMGVLAVSYGIARL
jgi:hypothetical protein